MQAAARDPTGISKTCIAGRSCACSGRLLLLPGTKLRSGCAVLPGYIMQSRLALRLTHQSLPCSAAALHTKEPALTACMALNVLWVVCCRLYQAEQQPSLHCAQEPASSQLNNSAKKLLVGGPSTQVDQHLPSSMLQQMYSQPSCSRACQAGGWCSMPCGQCHVGDWVRLALGCSLRFVQ